MVFGIGMEQSAGSMPHGKLPAGIAAELRQHVEVAFFLWHCGKHAQKIYFHETYPGGFITQYAQKSLCPGNMPKNLCPGNVAKLHMSEAHATFDNVRDECSRTIPAKNVRKYNARNICRK